MQNRKLVISVIVLLVAAFFFFDLGRFFSLEYIKSEQAALADLYANKPAMVIAGFFLIYVLVTALSLPGAAILTLAGGCLLYTSPSPRDKRQSRMPSSA